MPKSFVKKIAAKNVKAREVGGATDYPEVFSYLLLFSALNFSNKKI